MLLLYRKCQPKYPIIGSTIDISICFPALRKNIIVLNVILIFHQRYLGKVCNIRRFVVRLRGDRAVENAVNTV